MNRAIRWIALVAVSATFVSADQRVYVKFSPGAKEKVKAAIADVGGRFKHEFDDIDAASVVLSDAARAALKNHPELLTVEDDPVRGFLAQTVPYGITMVQAPAAVAAGATGAGIKIGVIDSGVFAGHEDLKSVAIAGDPDFGPNDERTWYRDNLSHGTHVVGTLAAANNSLGVIGVSPGAVSIHMVKVFGDTGEWIYSSDLLDAARTAAGKGSKIISMSLGGGTPSKTEQKGLDDLYNKRGVLLIAAAGNDGTTDVSYPAGYSSVISVAAIDEAKVVAAFSQQNSDVELAGPGVSVLSTVSYIDTSFVSSGSTKVLAQHIEFSARGSVTATLAYGGLGDTTNAAWKGKVVLIDRGAVSFYTKVHNAELSGAVGCVLANNDTANPDDNFSGTLGDGNTSTIPAVSVSYNGGLKLRAFVGKTVTLTTTFQQPVSGYDYFDGTSMATPHVSGVAALIWSKYPGATAAQVRQALDSSAQDLGAPGRDPAYGYGLVQAKAALTALAALHPATRTGDVTPPVLSGFTAAPVGKGGTYAISWTTNEPSTTNLTINGVTDFDAKLVTHHSRTYAANRGEKYSISAASTDAAGNTGTADPKIVTVP